jgi:hypothetical protein
VDHRPKCKITKLIEYNTGENLGDRVFGDDLLASTLKTQSMKKISGTSVILKTFASQKTLLKE